MLIGIVNDPHYGFAGMHSRKVHERFSQLIADKIGELDVRAFIVAGDIATSRQAEIEAFFKLYKSKISVPFMCVFGNHDYWDEKGGPLPNGRYGQRQASQLFRLHEELCEKYGVHYLGSGDMVIDDVRFCGYDGWYKHVDVQTRDLEHMVQMIEGAPAHLYMNDRAHKDCGRVLLSAERAKENKLVCVSHFDSVPVNGEGHIYGGDISQFYALSERFDLVIYGHSHKRHDLKVNRAHFVSPGGGYDDPTLLIYDLEAGRIHSFHKLSWTKRHPRDTPELK
nr:hypothetical protein BdHM001_36550 [Bdellovibrio sp. HM001]